MRIIFDKENKATIAIGYHNGRRIKAVCICHDGDEFNEEFGKQLVKKKWKLKANIKEQRDIYNEIKDVRNYLKYLEAESFRLYKKERD